MPIARALEKDAEAVLRGKPHASDNGHFEAAIRPKENLRAGISGDFLDAAYQNIPHLLAVLVSQHFSLMHQLHQNLLFSLFRDRARAEVPDPDIFGIVRFHPVKPRFSGRKVFETIPHPVLTALML